MKRSKALNIGLISTMLFLSACGGGGGGGGFAGGGDTAGGNGTADDTATISAVGGTGTAANGGAGGQIHITNAATDIKILKSGSVDTSFTAPSFSEDLGSRPLTIATNTEIKVCASEPAAGTPYMVNGDANIYIADGVAPMQDAAKERVSGLKVAAGATLTLNMNNGAETQVSLMNDIVINGTVCTKFNGPDRAGLYLGSAAGLYVGAQGLIDTSVSSGGKGGKQTLITTAKPIVIAGNLNSSGGSGATGNEAGYMVIATQNAPIYLLDGSSIQANGGRGTSGNGGASNQVNIQTKQNPIYSAASVELCGGQGTSAGGQGGTFVIYAGEAASGSGQMTSSGDITMDGGQGGSGNGGQGGSCSITTFGGNTLSSGAISAAGGASSGATGGAGGYININAKKVGATAPGAVRLSGDLILDGGQGKTGGTAGELTINSTEPLASANPPAGVIELLGYTAVDLKGGLGATIGGAGRQTGFSTAAVAVGGDYYASGGFTNEASFDLRGGYGQTKGGQGGQFMVNTHDKNVSASINNKGSINISGGNGDSGGDSGTIFQLIGKGITNSGALLAEGGQALTITAGKSVTNLTIKSSAACSSNARVSVKGGQALNAATAGNAGQITVSGTALSLAGTLDATGGAAATVGKHGKGGCVNLSATLNLDYTKALISVLDGNNSLGTGSIIINSANHTGDGTLP